MSGNIYIFGGHKLAFGYHQKLEHAKTNLELDCREIFCLSADPSDPAHHSLPQKKRLETMPSTFLAHCALAQQRWHKDDIIIPDHTAKHLLLMAYMELTRQILPQAKVELIPLNLDLETPFLHKSENDAIWAVSYATWMCPPDCDEPEICPHIQNTRSWDFFEAMAKSLKKKKQESSLVYRYGCRPIFAEISHIPLKTIVEDMQDYIKKLQGGLRPHVIVATHSHCHGIVGQFEVKIP